MHKGPPACSGPAVFSQKFSINYRLHNSASTPEHRKKYSAHKHTQHCVCINSVSFVKSLTVVIRIAEKMRQF